MLYNATHHLFLRQAPKSRGGPKTTGNKPTQVFSCALLSPDTSSETTKDGIHREQTGRRGHKQHHDTALNRQNKSSSWNVLYAGKNDTRHLSDATRHTPNTTMPPLRHTQNCTMPKEGSEPKLFLNTITRNIAATPHHTRVCEHKTKNRKRQGTFQKPAT